MYDGAQEYQGRVAAEERRLATSGEEYSEEDLNLARLDAGLYTLQQVPKYLKNYPKSNIDY